MVLSTATVLNGAGLVLAEKGRTDYQIVLPDEVPGAVIWRPVLAHGVEGK